MLFLSSCFARGGGRGGGRGVGGAAGQNHRGVSFTSVWCDNVSGNRPQGTVLIGGARNLLVLFSFTIVCSLAGGGSHHEVQFCSVITGRNYSFNKIEKSLVFFLGGGVFFQKK